MLSVAEPIRRPIGASTPARALGGGADRPVDFGHGHVPGQDVDPPKELANRAVERRGFGPFGQTEQ